MIVAGDNVFDAGVKELRRHFPWPQQGLRQIDGLVAGKNHDLSRRRLPAGALGFGQSVASVFLADADQMFGAGALRLNQFSRFVKYLPLTVAPIESNEV